MDEIIKRIELVALAKENLFDLHVVREKYEPLLRVIKDANEHSINL